MKKIFNFSHRRPDHVAVELARVLSEGEAFEFKPLFLIIHAKLKARNAAGGGEEMLRLRSYEKLQILVAGGIVTKMGKQYRGVAAELATFLDTNAA